MFRVTLCPLVLRGFGSRCLAPVVCRSLGPFLRDMFRVTLWLVLIERDMFAVTLGVFPVQALRDMFRVTLAGFLPG